MRSMVAKIALLSARLPACKKCALTVWRYSADDVADATLLVVGTAALAYNAAVSEVGRMDLALWVSSIVAFVRAGYPAGMPTTGYVPLAALGSPATLPTTRSAPSQANS